MKIDSVPFRVQTCDKNATGVTCSSSPHFANGFFLLLLLVDLAIEVDTGILGDRNIEQNYMRFQNR